MKKKRTDDDDDDESVAALVSFIGIIRRAFYLFRVVL
jgi:hypothetical protein